MSHTRLGGYEDQSAGVHGRFELEDLVDRIVENRDLRRFIRVHCSDRKERVGCLWALAEKYKPFQNRCFGVLPQAGVGNMDMPSSLYAGFGVTIFSFGGQRGRVSRAAIQIDGSSR